MIQITHDIDENLHGISEYVELSKPQQTCQYHIGQVVICVPKCKNCDARAQLYYPGRGNFCDNHKLTWRCEESITHFHRRVISVDSKLLNDQLYWVIQLK